MICYQIATYLDPSTFKHLDPQELLDAQSVIKSKKSIIQKAINKKNRLESSRETNLTNKPNSEIVELAEMCNYFESTADDNQTAVNH